MSKVIFLDIDGVLIPLPTTRGLHLDLRNADPEAMDLLNILALVSGAKIVVSSSWRIGRSVSALDSLLKRWGFRGEVIDKTGPIIGVEEDRGALISSWLVEHPDVKKFVILDDESTDLEPLADHMVYVKRDKGIQLHDVSFALRILR